MDHDIPEVEKEGCVPEFGDRSDNPEPKIKNIFIPVWKQNPDSVLMVKPYDIRTSLAFRAQYAIPGHET